MFADLAAWLAEMGRFADRLANYEAPREVMSGVGTSDLVD